LNVFYYKLLIIPIYQDNHKSLFVVTGMQNTTSHRTRLVTTDHLCILHFEPGNSILEPSLVNIHANNIRLLLNKLYRCHFRNSDNNMFINPFTSRSMHLKRPKSKRVLSIMMQQFLFLDSFKIAYIQNCLYQYAYQGMMLMLVLELSATFTVSSDCQVIPLLMKMSTQCLKVFFQEIANLLLQGQC
jgi:hypothetical protein